LLHVVVGDAIEFGSEKVFDPALNFFKKLFSVAMIGAKLSGCIKVD
jgi:hypothetical protein